MLKMTLAISLSCLIFSGSLSAIEQQTPLIPREILFGNPEKASPNLSPDGKWLAYLAPDENNVLNVWIRDLTGLTQDRMVTADKKRGIRSFGWQYDNQHILYAQDRDGDENWHLYQTDIDSHVTRDLTPFEGVMAGVLAYSPQFPNEILVQLNRHNPSLFDVYRIDLENGAVDLVAENEHDSFQWKADHNHQVRASTAFDREGATIIRTRDDHNSEWRELMRWEPEDDGQLVGFSPDNQSLYILTNLDCNTSRLVAVDLTDGSQTVIAEDCNHDLSGEIMRHPTSHELEAIAITRERSEWIVLDPKVEADFARLQEPEVEMAVVSRDLADRHWVLVVGADQKPARYFLYDREEKTKRLLFKAKPKLDAYPLSAMRSISYEARDGMQLHGYLTLPVGCEPKELPTVLLVHGGPWVRDSWGYSPLTQWLANRGYAVLQINYRGSQGYGKEYLNAGNREWGGKMHTDLLDGKQWLIDQGTTDPDKVAIVGGSYGGYATLVGMAFTPTEFCCGIDIVGPSNLVTLLESFPPYWNPLKRQMDLRIGSLENDREFLESRSPVFKADQICRPLLIAQGANDPRVNQAESDQIVDAMRANGQEVEYLLMDDEGHGFARPENMVEFCEAAERFLHDHLGGRLES